MRIRGVTDGLAHGRSVFGSWSLRFPNARKYEPILFSGWARAREVICVRFPDSVPIKDFVRKPVLCHLLPERGALQKHPV
jgi:hypothetical protein